MARATVAGPEQAEVQSLLLALAGQGLSSRQEALVLQLKGQWHHRCGEHQAAAQAWRSSLRLEPAVGPALGWLELVLAQGLPASDGELREVLAALGALDAEISVGRWLEGVLAALPLEQQRQDLLQRWQACGGP